MIHTKIKELNIWGGTYNSIDEVPENREVVDSSPNDEITPIWDGAKWIESATNEEKEIFIKEKIAALNEETKVLLEPTDWALVRELDESANWKAVPESIKNERLNIRQKQWEKEQEIIQKYS